MSNIGTVYRATLLPSLDLGNATSETAFLNSRSQVATLILQTDGQFKNTRFTLYAGGRVATNSNLAFTVNVYLGTTGTTADKLLFSSGAQTVNAKKSNWHMDLNMFWDADSQLINGYGYGQMDNGPIGAAGLASVAAVDPFLHSSSNSFQGTFYKFTVTGTFYGSSAGNHAFLDVLEVV